MPRLRLLGDEIRHTATESEAFAANKDQNLVAAVLAKIARDFVRDQFVRIIEHEDLRGGLASFANEIAPVAFVAAPVPPDREWVPAVSQRGE